MQYGPKTIGRYCLKSYLIKGHTPSAQTVQDDPVLYMVQLHKNMAVVRDHSPVIPNIIYPKDYLKKCHA